MEADIKLDGTVVAIEGDRLDVKGADLILDSSARRKQAGGFRRALVHSERDSLIINFNGDYPAGVEMKGQVLVDRLSVQFSRVIGQRPEFDPRTGRTTMRDILQIGPQDVAELIKNLERSVAALTARLTKLEGGR
jgi:hypothetical protein